MTSVADSKEKEAVATGKFRPAQRVAKYAAETVWHVFTPLAASSKAVNLGSLCASRSALKFVVSFCRSGLSRLVAA